MGKEFTVGDLEARIDADTVETQAKLDTILAYLRPPLEDPAKPKTEDRNSEGWGYVAAGLVACFALYLNHIGVEHALDLAYGMMALAGLYGTGRSVKKAAEATANGKNGNGNGTTAPTVDLDVGAIVSGLLRNNTTEFSLPDVERTVKSIVREIKGIF